MNLKKAIYLIGFVLICLGVKAQELPSKTKVNLSTNVLTRHLWRGGISGTAPTIEPTLEIQTGKLTIGAWGAYAFDKSYQEVDLYLSYNTPLFQFSLYDFYCPKSDFSDSKFFDLNSKKSVHMFDAVAKYKGCAKFPVSLMGSVIFFGQSDKNSKGDQRYSTYFELGYANKIGGKKFTYALGLTPFKGMYDNTFNVVNVNMTMYDEIKFSSSFSLPIRAGLTLNPARERVYLQFGFTIR